MATFTVAPVLSHLSNLPFEPLSDEELLKFYKEIDRNNDGYVEFSELEHKLEEVLQEIAPGPKHHNLHQRRMLENRSHGVRDLEKGDPERDGLHAFLCGLLPGCGAKTPKEQFIDHVRQFRIPSQHQPSSEEADTENDGCERKMPIGRRIKAHWSVERLKILFLCLVAGLMIALVIWELVKFLNRSDVRAALGSGAVLAKTCACVLYPTLFFMILSMSRHFATFMRQYYYISRFINWDLH